MQDDGKYASKTRAKSYKWSLCGVALTEQKGTKHMAKLNENFFNLKKNYLFIDIGKRVKAYTAAHPEAKLIRMGIGDVTQPLDRKSTRLNSSH